MSHQDQEDIRTSPRNLEDVFRFLLPPHATDAARHGNAVIDAFTLAAVAIASWGWSGKRTLTQRVAEGVAAVRRLFPACHPLSRQGLCQALATCGEDVAAMVRDHAKQQLRNLKGYWTTAGKPTFAVDGTKFTASRTRANQDEFAVAARKKNRKGKKYKKAADAAKAMSVQVLTTVFWHLGSGLPVSWRITPSSGSERQMAADMLTELPAGARVVGDAEYIGRPFWSEILESGRSFVVRVGSNVTLLKKLDPRLKCRRDIVYFWPDRARKNNEPPMILRLIQVRTPRGSMWLLTNEFDLTDRQIEELYRARWGVEVFFRTVKQNCGKAKLLCRTPGNIRSELNWTLLGIWGSLFVAKLDFKEQQQPLCHLSPTQVLDALAEALMQTAFGHPSDDDLQLHTCLKADESRRTTSKRSRTYPRKKKPKRCGAPIVTQATPAQIAAAKIYF
jgi:hypothetical protein